ncbi:hypothetical protein Ahy_A07g033320 [Arachis hypogaea]|uniref:Uncharacterized protein n=1 Tax=Arachis hypogaea TaxID=3818 RepID=A0A445C909_ARAHY|nr:hypothetical protein Ahy_A07g033320 [Arachis hypogaea]
MLPTTSVKALAEHCSAISLPRITEGCELQMLKFSLFMVIGNIIGYATGSYSGWHTIFPFTVTVGCNISCANLKSAFYLDVGFMVITTLYQHHVPQGSIGESGGASEEPFLWELFGTFKYFSKTIDNTICLCLNMDCLIGWDERFTVVNQIKGVGMGAFGLLLNSVVLGIISVLMESQCRNIRRKKSGYLGKDLPPFTIVAAASTIFTILGSPLAVRCQTRFDTSNKYHHVYLTLKLY